MASLTARRLSQRAAPRVQGLRTPAKTVKTMWSGASVMC